MSIETWVDEIHVFGMTLLLLLIDAAAGFSLYVGQKGRCGEMKAVSTVREPPDRRVG